MEKTDAFGIRHVIDVHWRSAPSRLCGCADARGRAISRRVDPGTRPCRLGPSAIDSLLLACIHPVMHHQNTERILWIYDTHILASALTRDDFGEFVHLARRKNIAAVCASQLQRAQSLFGTTLPADVLTGLSEAAHEPSSGYLESHRTWRHEFASVLRTLPDWRTRASYLRNVLLPAPDYMRDAYGLKSGLASNLVLPVLYIHRNVYGGWKILVGRK